MFDSSNSLFFKPGFETKMQRAMDTQIIQLYKHQYQIPEDHTIVSIAVIIQTTMKHASTVLKNFHPALFSFTPFVFLSTSLSPPLSFCPLVFHTLCLSVYFPFIPFVFLSTSLSHHLSFCPLHFHNLCLSIHFSVTP